MTADASTICNDQTYYDESGTLKTGERQCSLSDPNLKPENIKNGISIAGTTGSYTPDFPDPSNVSASDTVDGITGTLGTCSTDGATSCIADGDYKAVDTTQLTQWDIKTGKVAGGISGALKYNCRNTARTTLYQSTGLPDNSDLTDGGALQWWDTIDLYNNSDSLPTEQPVGWDSSMHCGKEIWSDLTDDLG